MAARKKSKAKNAKSTGMTKKMASSRPGKDKDRAKGKVPSVSRQSTAPKRKRAAAKAVEPSKPVILKARGATKTARASAKTVARGKAAMATLNPKSGKRSDSNEVDVRLKLSKEPKLEECSVLVASQTLVLATPAFKRASLTGAVVPAVEKATASGDGRTPPARQEPAQKLSRNPSHRHGFKLNEFVVYPAHGVGQVTGIEEQEVAGFKLELFVISFAKDKMTLRVPTSKVSGVGMRKISDFEAAEKALEILTGRARVKRTMWSRRAQEYEAKINSGDINAIAEVVRDLYRSDAQPEQSYSERQLYEAALDRMVREISAVQKSTEIEALRTVESRLQKSQGRGSKVSGAPEVLPKDPDIEEAA
jgi:CarD family transcriptional regulator